MSRPESLEHGSDQSLGAQWTPARGVGWGNTGGVRGAFWWYSHSMLAAVAVEEHSSAVVVGVPSGRDPL